MNFRTGILTLLGLLIAGIALGQEIDEEITNPQTRQKIEAAKVAYITKRLNLTTRESEGFWAIHNEYEGAKRQVRKKYQNRQPLEAMSDAEVERMIEQRFEMQQQLLNTDIEYYEKFKTVISTRKIALYIKAEKEFRLELLKRVKEERQNRGRPGGRFRNK
jgi:hypothetical protein